MATIRVETFVPAPPERVYEALLDPGMHARTAPGRERVVSGSAPLGLGDEVTFEATHFGVRQRLSARITLIDPPHAFEDTMTRGPFKRLWHRHEFLLAEGGTQMVDVMEVVSHFGAWPDRLILAPFMRRFLARRGKRLADLLS